MSKKVKTQSACRVANNSEQNSKRHKQSRVIHSGAVNDRTQHKIPAKTYALDVTIVLNRGICRITHRFTQHLWLLRYEEQAG